MENKFQYTTAIDKIRRMTARKKVIQGGTSASKTFGILSVLIEKATQNPNTEISVVSESIPHLRRGCIKDFIKIMKSTNRFVESRWNKTLFTYTFYNNSYIEFFSVDTEGRLRGARRNVLFVNEANNITFEAYQQLAIRTSDEIYLDYNPSREFWVHTEVLPEPDSELLIVTYLDNEALPHNTFLELEERKKKANTSSYWANWVRVYIYGQIGMLQGTIFDDFEMVDSIDVTNSKFVAFGLDWGFAQDPTALVAIYRNKDELYLHELLYDKNLTNQDIASKLKYYNISRSFEIVADSAEPKSIEEIRRLGYNIVPAKKGADSIRNGIDILKRYKLKVTKESVNLIKEFRSYTWATDRDGNTTGVPIDSFNHCCDAIRYVALNKLGVTNSGKYAILNT